MKIAIVLLVLTVCWIAASNAEGVKSVGPSWTNRKLNVKYADPTVVVLYQHFVKLLLNDAWRVYNSIDFTVSSVKRTIEVLRVSKKAIQQCYNYNTADVAKVCALEELRKARLEFDAIKAHGQKLSESS